MIWLTFDQPAAPDVCQDNLPSCRQIADDREADESCAVAVNELSLVVTHDIQTNAPAHKPQTLKLRKPQQQ
jgi:hypothetical protein